MASTRIKDDNDQAASVETGDAILMQAEADNKDYWFTITQLINKVRTGIGSATDLLAGLFSADDKKKLDSFPDTTVADQVLETTASGIKVWNNKKLGDMTKAVFESGANPGQVSNADKADKITVEPGADFVWTTDSGAVQGWLPKSDFVAGAATKIDQDPGNLFMYTTDSSGTQIWLSQAAFINTILLAENTVEARQWTGSTANGVLTEIFLKGTPGGRFEVDDDDAYEILVRTFHIREDDPTKYRIEQKRLVVAHFAAGDLVLIGTVETDADMGKDTTAAAVISTITVDGPNHEVVIKVQGIDTESWQHAVTATLTKITK